MYFYDSAWTRQFIVSSPSYLAAIASSTSLSSPSPCSAPLALSLPLPLLLLPPRLAHCLPLLPICPHSASSRAPSSSASDSEESWVTSLSPSLRL